jgi:hypothetical protein
VLPPITLNGIRYRVLRLEGEAGGMRFLLRSDAGELFGVYARNAQTALSAAPLELKLTVDNLVSRLRLLRDGSRRSGRAAFRSSTTRRR